MNILTIPALFGGKSHTIPLYVLHQRYIRRLNDVNNYFLINATEKENFLNKNILLADVDYSSKVKNPRDIDKDDVIDQLEKEKEAFKLVKPHIIIEDSAFMSPLIAEKNDVPRISIQRTGFFRSIDEKYRNSEHMLSLQKDENGKNFGEIVFFKGADIQEDKIGDIHYLKNYLNAKTKIIPGIPSIEVLPDDIPFKESYFYCGPLTIEDNPSEKLKEELDLFFNANNNRKKVFITTGLVDKTPIKKYVDFLLAKQYAVISTVAVEVEGNYTGQFFKNRFLPLNYVCSMVDLIIHQCGSGMYHYPIMNLKPFITIGTRCYDREDVAIKLQLLKVSKHIPHPVDDSNYFEIFKSHLNCFENETLCDFTKLKILQDEVYQTMIDFDIEKIINYTLS